MRRNPAKAASATNWNFPDPSLGMGLYVHIPFCETKCPYCDFNTYSGIEQLIPSYMDALRAELLDWGEGLSHPPLESVFFGGGTPSYLPENELSATLDSIRGSFELQPDAEITIEANPGDIALSKLDSWLVAGVNRLSVGIQSFDDGLLTLLGRRHNAEEAATAFRLARSAGFRNASIDLMYGLPQQDLRQWIGTLDRAMELEPTHISLYSLQIEPGTPFDRDLRLGRMQIPDEDLAADMYEHAMERLKSAGFQHYEISNWSLPGLESRHNLLYWRNRPYLGVGPGAHSSLKGQRFANLKSPRSYVARATKLPATGPDGDPIEWMREHGPIDFHEVTTRGMAMSETMMMGLRLAEGVGDTTFRAMFGVGLDDQYRDAIGDLCRSGLLEWADDSLRLTSRGRPLGNEVFARFVQV